MVFAQFLCSTIERKCNSQELELSSSQVNHSLSSLRIFHSASTSFSSIYIIIEREQTPGEFLPRSVISSTTRSKGLQYEPNNSEKLSRGPAGKREPRAFNPKETILRISVESAARHARPTPLKNFPRLRSPISS